MGDSTIIDRLLNSLEKYGISEIVMVTGFRANLLSNHVQEKHPHQKFTFVFNEEYATTLPAYGLWLAREHFDNNGETLYLNSDVICDSEIIRDVITYPEDSVTAIRPSDWEEEEVNVILDTEERVSVIGKHVQKDESRGEFIGVTKFGPTFTPFLIDALNTFEKSGDRQRFAVDSMNAAIQNGGILHMLDTAKRTACEVDTIEDYEAAKEKCE